MLISLGMKIICLIQYSIDTIMLDDKWSYETYQVETPLRR